MSAMLRGFRLPALLLVGVASLATACRPDLLVQVATRVYHDGALGRIIEIRGRTSDGETPTKADWLGSDVGIRLARPDAWSRVDETPGGLHAEGFFPSAGELPPLLTFATEQGSRTDRLQTDLVIEGRVVLKRWVYRERHSDPYSAGEVQSALDTLVELIVEAVEFELRREFGSGLDTSGAATFLRSEGRGFASALLSVRRRNATVENYDRRAELWRQVLSQYGMRTMSFDSDEFDFWDVHVPVIMRWLRDRIAAAVSTPEQTIAGSDLSFWPIDEDDMDKLEAIIERTWGGDGRLQELAGPPFAALSGYYGADDSPRFRFHSRVELPGVLLRTNGTPSGDGIVWAFRAEDLSFGDVILRAESAEPEKDALTHIGARRDFEPIELAQLVDLLWERDPDGVLGELLVAAAERGSLAPLRDDDAIPGTYAERARELLELLDPAVELPPRLD